MDYLVVPITGKRLESVMLRISEFIWLMLEITVAALIHQNILTI